jgi:hypothetical protein
MMSFPDINPWAVALAGFVHMVIGLVWFMPKFFGNAWAGLTGKDLEPAVRWIPAGIVGHLVMALVLAIMVGLGDASTVLGGIVAGVLAWAGFVVTLETGELIWEKIPLRLFLIRVGNHLLGLSTAGVILAVWR